MAKKKKKINEMSFLDHLEDLRWNLIRATSAIMIIGTLAFVFSRSIFKLIIFAPLDMSFPTYSMLCKASKFINVETTFCAEEMPRISQSRTDGWAGVRGCMDLYLRRIHHRFSVCYLSVMEIHQSRNA